MIFGLNPSVDAFVFTIVKYLDHFIFIILLLLYFDILLAKYGG